MKNKGMQLGAMLAVMLIAGLMLASVASAQTPVPTSLPTVSNSTWLDGGYATKSGTSMAAPFVSGVVALIKSKNLSMISQEIRDALAHNAVDLGDAGRDRRYGFGLVQAG